MKPAKNLRREAYYPFPVETVWQALTDPQALAEWLMPNNFRAEVGHRFRFHVDPAPGYSGVSECEVLAVERPRRLVYNWVLVPAKAGALRPEPMVLTWTLSAEGEGTRLVLEQTGLEHLGWFSRVSMGMGWGRMLKSLLPIVLKNIEGGRYRTGSVSLRKRCYGIKTVPDGFAK